jgi:hypothetical protein
MVTTLWGQKWEASLRAVERPEPCKMSPASSTPTYQIMAHIVGTEMGGQPQNYGEVRTLGNEFSL